MCDTAVVSSTQRPRRAHLRSRRYARQPAGTRGASIARVRLALLAVGIALGCGPPPAAPWQPPPTFQPDETYHTRIANLRTTLGRAGIALRTRGVDQTYRSGGCQLGPLARARIGCSSCELAGETERLDGAALEAITRAFDLYPTDVLVGSRLDHVALCREISHVDGDDPTHPAGTVDLHGRGLLISVAHFLDRTYAVDGTFTTEEIAHHELFHLVEHVHMRELMSEDPEWDALNVGGFAYGVQPAGAAMPPGFVNTYAMTNAVEDRASVYQYLMARPDELCARVARDKILHAKAGIVWTRIARLLGDSFLRARAGCFVAGSDAS